MANNPLQQPSDIINDQQLTVGPVTVTGNFNMGAFNSLVLADTTSGGHTVTLPAAPVLSEAYEVKKVSADGNAVTITPPSGLIDGAASKTLTTQYQSIAASFDGTNWWTVQGAAAVGGVTSYNGRVGAVVPVNTDFLTPVDLTHANSPYTIVNHNVWLRCNTTAGDIIINPHAAPVDLDQVLVTNDVGTHNVDTRNIGSNGVILFPLQELLFRYDHITAGDYVPVTDPGNFNAAVTDGASLEVVSGLGGSPIARSRPFAWNSGVSYFKGQLALGSDGVIYMSTVTPNLNHNPVGDAGVHWLSAVFSNPMQLAGDMIFENASLNADRLPAGTSPGQAMVQGGIVSDFAVLGDNTHAIGSGTDAGMPSGNSAWWAVGWIKTGVGTAGALTQWGTVSAANTCANVIVDTLGHMRLEYNNGVTEHIFNMGINLADGNWHLIGMTWDGAGNATAFADNASAVVWAGGVVMAVALAGAAAYKLNTDLGSVDAAATLDRVASGAGAGVLTGTTFSQLYADKGNSAKYDVDLLALNPLHYHKLQEGAGNFADVGSLAVTLTAGAGVTYHQTGPLTTAAQPTWGNLLVGAGVPASTLGANGQAYLRTDGTAGAMIYTKSAGVWTAIL